MKKYYRPKNVLALAIKVVTISFASVGFFATISERLNPYIATISIVIVVFLILFFLLLSYFYRPYIYHYFGVYPPANFFVAHGKHTISVSDSGNADVKVRRNIIFYRAPRRWELYDLFGYHGDDISYKSRDALQINKQSKGNKTAIFWRPKKRIIPFSIYPHEYQWVTPFNLADQVNYWRVFLTSVVGKQVIIIQTKKDIIKVLAFRKPWYRLLESDEAVYNYASQIEDPKCPQPRLVGSKKIIWEIEYHELQQGAEYICVFYHEV